MREDELLQHIAGVARGSASSPLVIVGPGDDCAALAPHAAPLLLTVDQLIEGRHFDPSTSVDLIARKAVARSVSDIAAMGGSCAWSLGTGALPAGYPHERARELAEALHRWARHWSCPMVGGDLATLPAGAPMVLSVAVGGTPHPVRGPVLRSGAHVGEGVYVTGAIGSSLASGRHLRFEPRLVEGAWLAGALGQRLGAMIDLSDGLGRDAGRVARASGVRLELDHDLIPRHPDAGDSFIADGEDYELLLTACGDVPAICPITGTPITRIGRVLAGAGCVLRGHGREEDVSDAGWDH